LSLNGHFLPYLSAAIPKIAAPRKRGIRDRVKPSVMAEVGPPKSFARSEIIKVIEKKSKASQVQASRVYIKSVSQPSAEDIFDIE